MAIPSQYLDIHQVATRYSIKRRTVWRWVKQGILPAPVYFAGPGSGGKWPLDELEQRDAERLAAQRAA